MPGCSLGWFLLWSSEAPPAERPFRAQVLRDDHGRAGHEEYQRRGYRDGAVARRSPLENRHRDRTMASASRNAG